MFVGIKGQLIYYPSAVNIVVVVRLRVIVILSHWEASHVIANGPLGSSTHSLTRASVWEMSVDGQVRVVLELKLLLVWVWAVTRVHLPRRQLLRLQPLLVAPA